MSVSRHVRDERGTREHFNLVGKEIPYAHPVKAWCGAFVGREFHFLDAEHAISYLVDGGSITPCRFCLIKLREILNQELSNLNGDA